MSIQDRIVVQPQIGPQQPLNLLRYISQTHPNNNKNKNKNYNSTKKYVQMPKIGIYEAWEISIIVLNYSDIDSSGIREAKND